MINARLVISTEHTRKYVLEVIYYLHLLYGSAITCLHTILWLLFGDVNDVTLPTQPVGDVTSMDR